MVMDHPLYVALIWHLHQPYYKDLATDEYWLPWVRLHAIKDYYPMAAFLEHYPDLRLNFNLVPSLLEQLEDYGRGSAMDRSLKLGLRPAKELTLAEKVDLLGLSFSANWETMVEPHRRYGELLQKKGKGGGEQKWVEAVPYFSTQDFLDLQVWSNLTWFHSALRESDPFLQHMVKQGRDFSEEEKLRLFEKQKEIINLILPLYKSLLDAGKIEISTSPYYHPILPLICDTDVAKEPSPDIVLPRHRFRHPEDARDQIERAIESFRKHFGKPPQGMWPSEGAVSQEAARLVAQAGIRWMASDEEILYRSLNLPLPRGDDRQPNQMKLLYQPHTLSGPNCKLTLLFRDHVLSDLIGFAYARWDPRQAAEDFLGRLHQIRNFLRDVSDEGPFLVTVILDGENAWEYYRNDGRDFLSFLYEGLSQNKLLQTTTVSDFLIKFPPRREIGFLASGSWINHDFRIWIGHEEDNAAWDLLTQTREDLLLLSNSTEGTAEREGEADSREKAWREVYIAEGSDWCWWYGDDHSSGMDEVFDSLFRKHLMNVYHFMGVEPPDRFFVPLICERGRIDNLTFEPADLIHPSIDGRLTDYFEWLPAGFRKLSEVGSAMHRVSTLAKAIYTGFDSSTLFLRIDLEKNSVSERSANELSVQIRFLAPYHIQLQTSLDSAAPKLAVKLYEAELPWHSNGPREIEAPGVEAAYKDIVEMAIPLRALRAAAGDYLQFIVILGEDGKEQERWPRTEFFKVKVPPGGYESTFWQA
jgi:alpha-amylase/alpha-mannosidase (GH57 family)